MIPGLTPAIITRSGGGGLLDGFYDDFASWDPDLYFVGLFGSDDSSAALITHNTAKVAMHFEPLKDWASVSTITFPTMKGIDYRVAVDVDNLGGGGQDEVSVRDGTNDAVIWSSRGSAGRRKLHTTTLTAPSALMRIYILLRGAPTANLDIYQIEATKT